jgi:hypothetical protein
MEWSGRPDLRLKIFSRQFTRPRSVRRQVGWPTARQGSPGATTGAAAHAARPRVELGDGLRRPLLAQSRRGSGQLAAVPQCGASRQAPGRTPGTYTMNEHRQLQFAFCTLWSAMFLAADAERHVCQSRAQDSVIACAIEMPALLHTHQEVEIRAP